MSLDGDQHPVVTLFGDSISAGYGLSRCDALPERLEAALSDLGVVSRVVGAGVDGDTTADGLRRLEWAIPAETDLCVVALGANDLMQGLPPQRIADTLDAIITTIRARSVEVLLCGMRAPPWLASYAQAFDAVFPAVAARHGVPLYPFLLDGVALDPRYNQSDQIHPNAAGIQIIADGLAPAIRDALRARTTVRP